MTLKLDDSIPKDQIHQTAVCQVTAIMSLFVERPVASLWRRDAKAGVGGG